VLVEFMFSVCFYWCISCSVIISYLLTAVFDARLMRLIKSVIQSFIIRYLHVFYFSDSSAFEQFTQKYNANKQVHKRLTIT